MSESANMPAKAAVPAAALAGSPFVPLLCFLTQSAKCFSKYTYIRTNQIRTYIIIKVRQ